MVATKLKSTEEVEIDSLDKALSVLNEAAENSAEEIQEMINKDYQSLQSVFPKEQTKVKENFSNIKESAVSSLAQAKERAVIMSKNAAENVDEAAHKNPWVFIGGTAAVSAILGFLLGRKFRS